MALEALIFDVDGTLADTEEAHRLAFNMAFADAGLDWQWDPEQYRRLLAVTGGKERITHYVRQSEPDFSVDGDFDEFVAELHKNKTSHYAGLLQGGGVPMRPGVLRLITEAHEAGLRLAIATTTSPGNIVALLEHSAPPEIAGWFEVIGHADVAPVKKPAPDVYHYVLDKLALAPERCVAFEDSENGIRASRDAGLKTIITVNHYTCDHSFDGACIVLDQMGEPDQPFQVLSDTVVNGCSYLDLALIKKVCRIS